MYISGITDGRYIFDTIFLFGTLYALAISSNEPSVEFIPVEIFDQTIGITIKNEVNTGTFFFVIHTSARIINDATGVERTTFIKGLNTARINSDFEVSTASAVPASNAER